MNLWSVAFAAFAVLCIAAGAASLRRATAATAAAAPDAAGPIPAATWLRWLLLPACSSALLLAATNTICQDIAAVPFLWILPLSLYLLSFVLCFDRPAFYRRGVWLRLLAVALGLMAYAGLERSVSLILDLFIFGGGLFICCMFCHGELAAAKPAPARLTLYYALLSLGGVIGALAVSLVAPAVFTGYTELPVALVFCALLALFTIYDSGWMVEAVWAAVVLLLAVAAGIRVKAEGADVRFAARNAYGALRVRQLAVEGEQVRRLFHGAIVHGVEMVRPELRLEPTAYYGRGSGVALALEHWRRPSMRVAAIGLGAGTIAAYSRPGDNYRFYEINPLVADVAQRYFAFLASSAGHMEVALGDARLTLAAERGTRYDALVVDAFSGDSVPVHLLTREAFGVYFDHLAPDGILAVHISNRYLKLAPVVAQLAAAWGRQARAISSPAQKTPDIYGADWVLVAPPAGFAARPLVTAATVPLTAAPGGRPWTDDFSNLLAVVRR
jgi:hypothetical protein